MVKDDAGPMPLAEPLSRALEQPGREVRQALRRRQEGFPDLGQRGRRQTRRQVVLDRQDGHNQRARPVPLPRVRSRERREEADRDDPPVLEGPRNPLISTKTGFDRQAQNGPFKTPGC